MISFIMISFFSSPKNEVYNVAVGHRTTLNTLFDALKKYLNANDVAFLEEPVFRGGEALSSSY